MPVYEDTVCGKRVRRWTCPFCNKRIIVIYPDHVQKLARRHLLNKHKDESWSDVDDAMNDLWEYCVYGDISDMSVDEILTEVVLNKL